MARNQRSRAQRASKSYRQPARDQTPKRQPVGFDEIRELMLTQPGRALDRAIEAFGEARGEEAPPELLDVVAKAVYAERGLEAASADVVFNDLGRRKLKQADRQYVTAVLLRILAANPHALPESVLRGYFRELIESLPERLVAALNLPRDTLEHRIVELPGVVSAAEERLERAFKVLSGIEGMRAFQSEFLRSLQSPFVAVAIRPFLPSHLLEGSVSALAKAVDRCVDLSAEDAFDRIEEARRQLRQFGEDARAVDSAYGDRYLVRVASVLSQDLERRFETSPVSHSAELRLAPLRKRLPLHREGAELRLQLQIENGGDGPARDVRVRFAEGGAVEPLEPHHLVGFVGTGGRKLIAPALVMQQCERALLTYEIEWRNSDGTEGECLEEVLLRAQDPSIDWAALAQLNPYPGQAIKDERLLAGRDQLLDQLTALATGPEVGSTRISGEKRIGKSSLARSLETRLNRLPEAPLLVVYVDVNKLGVAEDEPQAALAAVMRATSRRLKQTHTALADLPTPAFSDGGVDQFAEFLEAAREQLAGRGILVILDEFDELPNAVFERGGAGDPFFRALKAFSSEGDCGFFLVGGERLELALSRQLDRLNAFREHRVHYIGEEQLEDFVELVERPVRGFLEFDQDAVIDLHRRTAGHPFYTLLVCRELLARAIALRDNHVTVAEINEAYDAALQNAPATAFAHIWFDHVFAEPEVLEAVADRRLRVLLAWAAALRIGPPVTVAALLEEAQKYGLDAMRVREEVRELVARGLVREDRDGLIQARSAFIQDWLKEWGPERIRVDATASAALAKLESEEEAQRVRADEIRELRDSWPLYQSRRVEAEDIRAWLDQFAGARNQRLAFTVLRAVRFISNVELRSLYEAVHAQARRGTTIRLEPDKRYRREFAVVYAEADGKSASLMAKQYAHANQIHSSCIVAASRLDEHLAGRGYERVVIVDDFIGTGNTAIDRLGDHAQVIREAAEATERNVVFAVAVAFQEGERRVDEWITSNAVPVEIAVGETLVDSDRCFHENAGAFETTDDRLVARRLFEELARRVGSREPLGTGDLEALVVFEHNCPNNTLPLLWKKSDEWTPLFERLSAGR
jgi:hypothetical protein